MHGHGALHSRSALLKTACSPPDESKSLQVNSIGSHLTAMLNGSIVIAKREVYGPTAVAIDAGEDKPGPVALLGGHGPVEFRRLSATIELVKP